MPESETYVRESGDRNDAMAEVIAQSRQDGKCPLCQLLTGERTDQKIIFRDHGWAVIMNISSEPGAEYHFLIFSEIHPRSNHFSDLPLEVAMGRELVVRELEKLYGFKGWGYSTDCRRGFDGTHTAATVMHPCENLIVSDGRSVRPAEIILLLHEMLDDYGDRWVEVLRYLKPSKADRVYQQGGEGALLSEALRLMVEQINLKRSLLEGKARAIWRKVSNEATRPADPA